MTRLTVVAGAGGSGKSAIKVDLEKRLQGELDVYDFDAIGVAEKSDTRWRQETTKKWLEHILAKKKDALLLGQVVLGEILACSQAADLDAIDYILLDVSDFERVKRLKKRGSNDIDQTMLNWASWLRMHCSDPQWMQHVIKEGSYKGLDFSVWDGQKKWDSFSQVKMIDTTKLSIFEVSQAVVQSLNGEF